MLNLRSYDVRRTRARARWRRLNAQITSQPETEPVGPDRRKAFAESPWNTIPGPEVDHRRLQSASTAGSSENQSLSLEVAEWPGSAAASPSTGTRTPLLERSRQNTTSSRCTEKSVSFRDDSSLKQFPGSSVDERFGDCFLNFHLKCSRLMSDRKGTIYDTILIILRFLLLMSGDMSFKTCDLFYI